MVQEILHQQRRRKEIMVALILEQVGVAVAVAHQVQVFRQDHLQMAVQAALVRLLQYLVYQ
ncbi:MAG: hypothetical protein EBS69_10505 [Verrucomicrobia bacterium]|nr:hypothetical protein [Verrucomicrobiota bacterium]NBS80019.1 hypothetical protein [bacterium]